MKSAELPLEEDNLSWDWGSNTLVITYAKPLKMLKIEEEQKKYRLSLPNAMHPGAIAGQNNSGQDNAPDCKQQ